MFIGIIGPDLSPALETKPEENLTQTLSYGSPSNYNIVGIEPYMLPQDYSTFNNLFNKLSLYLDQAKKKGWLNENTIVLFPEHIGTWLVSAYAPLNTYKAKTTEEVLEITIRDNLVQSVVAYMDNVQKGGLYETAFRAKAGIMIKGYRDVFGILSEKYQVTIIAGSVATTDIPLDDRGWWKLEWNNYYGGLKTPIPLANKSNIFGDVSQKRNFFFLDVEPRTPHYHFGLSIVTNEQIHYGPSYQYNTISAKHYLTSKDINFITPSNIGRSSFQVEGLGKVSVAIGVDSWHPDLYDELPETKVMLVPSFLTDVTWDEPWRGYDGEEAPDDIDPTDIGNITEGEAWEKYGLPYHAKKHNIKWGMNVFFKGQLWDIKGEGRAIILENGITHVVPETEGGAIYNLWIDVEKTQ